MKTRRAERLLELDDVERRLKPFRRRYLAVRAIPLEALVGTDGRANAATIAPPWHGEAAPRRSMPTSPSCSRTSRCTATT